MIPILYESTETAFTSNGLGRLRDCISCVVTEERNGIYECDFEYPIDGVNYDRIKCGRIILVEHDESNDVQPFDIVGYSRPINGVVTFHAVHISYRQCALTVAGNIDWNNVNTLADALNWLTTADPENPFAYWTDKSSSTGYLLASNGIPYSVRSVLGGMEGSILDVYGGEYEWDRWTVRLWDARGSIKNFSIRYGVNLTNYEEEMDYSDTYTSVVPYWAGQDNNGNDIVVKGDMQTASYPSFNGTGRCVPLDLTDKYETKPTKATLEAAGLAYINANQTYLPAQSIKVDFVKLSDSDEYAQFANLQKCKLCDTINVIFPRYDMQGMFKIVKTEYNVLREKYDSLELGTLSTSLAEALGISQDGSTKLGATAGVNTAYGHLTGYTTSVSLTTSAQKIPLNTTFIGSGCTKSSNGIKVDEAGLYVISGSAYFSTGFTANDIVHVLVYVNSTPKVEAITRIGTANYYVTVSATPIIVSLSADDVVYLYAYNQGGNRGICEGRLGNGLTIFRIA